MKKIHNIIKYKYLKSIIIILCLFVFSIAEAQLVKINNKSIVNTKPFLYVPFNESHEELSVDQYLYIKNKIKYNCDSLNLKHSINHLKSDSHPLFSWPLKTKEGFTDPGYYTICKYVDHNPSYPDELLDYNCGEITYDRDYGYNHQGTDFCTWPFPWQKMDEDVVEVIAAASGTIIFKQDGNYDRECEINDRDWNVICIQHIDGSQAWYGHLKKYSLTEKNVGDAVVTGEYLGIVGSSGCSTGPHLHFEVHDANDSLIDPFWGSCNSLNEDTWWENQVSYFEPGINKISTNFKPPVLTECPNPHIGNESDTFQLQDTIFITLYFKNISLNDEVKFTINDPNSNLWYSWDWTNNYDSYTASYFYWYVILGSDEQLDKWKLEIEYQNNVYEHNFWVLEEYIQHNSIFQKYNGTFTIYPNPANDYINISIPEYTHSDIQVKIFDLNSMIVKSKKYKIQDEEIIINISEMPPGLYFVEILSDNKLFHNIICIQ